MIQELHAKRAIYFHLSNKWMQRNAKCWQIVCNVRWFHNGWRDVLPYDLNRTAARIWRTQPTACFCSIASRALLYFRINLSSNGVLSRIFSTLHLLSFRKYSFENILVGNCPGALNKKIRKKIIFLLWCYPASSALLLPPCFAYLIVLRCLSSVQLASHRLALFSCLHCIRVIPAFCSLIRVLC